ncbi:MAG: protein BatD, partial [Tidjanibacter sp.]|nr:protein BatD [Tidjanibacter sp.]
RTKQFVMKRLITLLFTLFLTLTLSGQAVEFTVDGPSVVTVGEVFRVEFSLNEKADSFTPPSFEGFTVLAGPSTSTYSQRSIINGQITSSTTYGYTYVLQCSEAGIHTIGPAEAEAGKQTVRTRPFSIEAVADQQSPATPQGGGSPQQGSPQQGSPQGSQGVVADGDVVLRLVVDRTEVWKGEPVRAAIKLYTRQSLSAVEGAKYPSFNGFWTQELNADNYQWQRENYNNRVYDARILREWLIFPQQSGALEVERTEMTAIVQIVTRSRSQSLFDDFFGGGPSVQEIPISLVAPAVKINVKELPAGAPADFAGAVGSFDMAVTLPAEEMVANSAVDYVVRISGEGNLPLVQAPKLSLPTSFEQYNIKTTESLNATQGGISGYRQFEYPVIARAEGEFDLPAITFSYFDPKEAAYKTLSSEARTYNVLPDNSYAGGTSRGLVSGVNKEDIKFLGQDIRFIKIGNGHLRKVTNINMSVFTYLAVVLLIVVAAVLTYVYLRRYLREMRNNALMKGKRANKVALQRFRAAERYMTEGDQRGFYEEMLRGMWGYVSDRFNIPVANLTKENIREELDKQGVEQADIEQYMTVISECEYAQYAPAASGKMREIYAAGVEIVSKFESVIHR